MQYRVPNAVPPTRMAQRQGRQAPPPPHLRRPSWWLRLASWGWDHPQKTIQTRERVRRSQLMAWILLGLLCVNIVLLPVGIDDPVTLAALLAFGTVLLISIGLNRIGWTTVAALTLITLLIVVPIGDLLTFPHGLTVDALPVYDLLVIAVVIATSILPRAAGFGVAIVNSVVIALDFVLQPHAPDLATELASYGTVTTGTIALLVRPIGLEIIIAVVAYLWVRGTDAAIRRADRAEELAALEHQLAEQKRQLDIGVQELLATHIRAANGDFTARAPLRQDNVLWQIASSLNNLLARMQRTAQAEHRLVRTEEELRRIAGAIDEARAGRPPFWPMPTGTAADLILERIARDQRRAPAGFGAPALPSHARGGAPFAPGYGPAPAGPSQPLPPGGFGQGGFGQGAVPSGYRQGGGGQGGFGGGFGAPVPSSQPADQAAIAQQPTSTSLGQSPSANDRWQPRAPSSTDQPPADQPPASPSVAPARPSAPSSPVPPSSWMLSQDELARDTKDQPPPDWPELPPVGEWTIPTDGQ